MARFWPNGVKIDITCDALATPQAFTWQGHRHVVSTVLERWRVDERWWRRRVWREYFILTTTTGLLALIYHDVRSDAWRLQRVYD